MTGHHQPDFVHYDYLFQVALAGWGHEFVLKLGQLCMLTKTRVVGCCHQHQLTSLTTDGALQVHPPTALVNEPVILASLCVDVSLPLQ